MVLMCKVLLPVSPVVVVRVMGVVCLEDAPVVMGGGRDGGVSECRRRHHCGK